MSDTYDEAAVQQILARARARQGQSDPLKRSQLIDMAREIGISPANFLAAEEEWLVRQEEQAARAAFDQYRHQQWLKGLRRFGIGSSLLLLSNLAATRQLSWSLYMALGWAIVLGLQGWQMYRASEDRYNRDFRRWWLRQQIGESFKAISERLRSAPAGSSQGGTHGATGGLTGSAAGGRQTSNAVSNPGDGPGAHHLSGREP
ncbi:MAG: 2TM domain-containing protein [Elainellaceae cyanobacterium]